MGSNLSLVAEFSGSVIPTANCRSGKIERFGVCLVSITREHQREYGEPERLKRNSTGTENEANPQILRIP